MALTPLDIHNKEFGRSFRGYDEDEVNDFLEQVMKDYEAALDRTKQLEAQLKNEQERVTHFTTIENTLQSSILIAQEAAEEVRRNSQKEAKLIVKEAEKNADRLVNDALSKARRIAIEIEELKKQSKVFRNRFRMLVEAQLELIQTDDWDVLMGYEIDTSELEKLEHLEED
ncbi:DivIVA domain-containing protein [Edaphobacillus lindanitolerans]|uniref:Cell division initiation protein n=1 Tax=Edaphobacillus lindanitolerans TaxID=550447 RepID=A0A1U7PLK4_9BACI|nr:DivIVA domain-containing protein [Edaphobacillus lindanitolerans]SIT67751.1 cell division initiation protein [Edaphobacillus lindanitolerans]